MRKAALQKINIPDVVDDLGRLRLGMDALTEAPVGPATGSPTEEPDGDRSRFRLPRPVSAAQAHLVSLLAYVALTGVAYWPVVGHLRSRILADSGDGAFYLWDMWWFPRALLHGQNPFHTDSVLHPLGANLGFNTILAPISLASWPIQKLFGLAVAANAVQLGAVVFAGLGMYLLALQAGAARFPAFVAGAVFAFTPYRIGQAPGHFNLNHTWLLVFGLWALLRLYERPSRGRAALLGGMLALTLWSDGYYSVILGLAVLTVLGWRWGDSLRPEVLRHLGLAALVAALLTLPLLGAMVTDLRGGELDPIPGWGGADVYSADVLSWITPSRDRRLLPDMLSGVDPVLTRGERLIFPTWTLLALGAAGAIWAGRRRSSIWVAIFIVFFLLSLGPFLQVNGWTGGAFRRFQTPFSVPLPGMALGSIPVVNGVRDPARFAVMAVLALTVLGALVLTRLQGRHGRFGMAVAGVVAVMALAESLPSKAITLPSAIPAPYKAIAADPGRGAVMEIPIQWRTGFGAYGEWNGDHTLFLYYATLHRKPMVNGMMPRYRQRTLDRLMRTPVYDEMLGFFTGPTAGVVESVPAGRPPGEPHPPATFTTADLRELGIGYVVYHRERPRPAAFDYLTRLQMPVLADDGTVMVWKVP
jgi:hypothetical protein